MLTSEGLLDKWNSLLAQTGGYTRVDQVHPLELYIGHESIRQKSMLIVSDAEPSLIPSSKSILVTVGRRTDGRWAMSIRLVRNEQEEVFVQLCTDLIESSRSQRNDRVGVEYVLSRYRRWHKLMEHQDSALLGESSQKGLLGELLFLQRALASSIPALEAVSGWIGPAGADRDFVFPDGWHEIKTQGASARAVKISSLEQLDAPSPGELVTYFIDRTAPMDSGSFSLYKQVNAVKAALQATPPALDLLEAKLFDAGYLPLKEYDVQHYRLSGMRRYTVDADFPRLTRATIPSQITSAVYEISLDALEDWRIE